MGTAFIVCGSPGAGKTTYGKALAQRVMGTFLDIDLVTENLVRVGLTESGHDQNDRDSEYFKLTYRKPIYDTLFKIAREHLPWQDVVIVGPFTRELRDPQWLEKLTKDLQHTVEVHYLYCEPQVRLERLRKRSDVRDASKFVNWEQFNRYYGDEAPPQFPHKYVDTTAVDPLKP